MSFEVSKRVLTCYIEPVLIYGCQTWVIGKLANKIPEPQKCQFTEDCGELHHHLHHHHHEVSCRLVWLVQILLSPTSLLRQPNCHLNVCKGAQRQLITTIKRRRQNLLPQLERERKTMKYSWQPIAMVWKGVSSQIDTWCRRWQDVEKHATHQPARWALVGRSIEPRQVRQLWQWLAFIWLSKQTSMLC